MNRMLRGIAAGTVGVMLALAASLATISIAAAAESDNEKYLLRYQFHPGETLRWEVEHRNKVRTTVAATTETIETLSKSAKVWRVSEVAPDGVATFEHSVEWVEMWRNLSDSGQSHYDSRTDATPPPGFESVAPSVGVPLAVVTMDTKGKILKRQRNEVKAMAPNEGYMTIPLPEEAVPVGYTWSYPQDIDIALEAGSIKKIKAVQQFTLESVKTGVATIRVSTNIITPVTDPALESKLIQRESDGRVRFDIDAGRVLAQQMDTDKHVMGFRGDASSIRYVNRFSEQLLPPEIKTAGRADAPAR